MKTKNKVILILGCMLLIIAISYTINAKNAQANSQKMCNHWEPAVNDCIRPPLSCGCTIVVIGHKGHSISSSNN